MKKLTILTSLMCLSVSSNAGLSEWFQEKIWKPIQNPTPMDFGYWECPDCSLPAPGTAMPPGSIPADLNMFIVANNDLLFADAKIDIRWKPGSIITICTKGGTSCITLRYVTASRAWLPIGPTYALPLGKTMKQGRSSGAQAPFDKKPRVEILTESSYTNSTVVNFLIPKTSVWPAPRIGTPSVTIVQQNGDSVTFKGSPVNLDTGENVETNTGESLRWQSESSTGLGNDSAGGGGAPLYPVLED